MKIPFTLEEWIKDRKRKVFTEEGKEFVVFNYQFDGFYPVRGHYKGNIDDIHCFNEKDLFIETEPESSEFEKAYMRIAHKREPEDFNDEGLKIAKEEAAELLELARKELEPEVLERLEIAYKNQDEVVYENGKRDGKAEALKDLPKWEKCNKNTIYNTKFNLMENGVGRFLMVEGYQINIDSLEKLPGFNE